MAYPILGQPEPQFFDDNGEPLDGGFLIFTDPDTLSTKPTYPTADDANAATSANTDPIVLNEDGRPPVQIWGIDDEKYKVELQDSASTPIWTADDIRFGDPLTQAEIDTILYQQSTAESDIGVTPTNYFRAYGDPRRYGFGWSYANV